MNNQQQYINNNEIIPIMSWKYYKIYLITFLKQLNNNNNQQQDLSIKMSINNIADPDLYILLNNFPNLNIYQWSNTNCNNCNNNEQESIIRITYDELIKMNDNDTLIMGIYGYCCYQANINLIVELVKPLQYQSF